VSEAEVYEMVHDPGQGVGKKKVLIKVQGDKVLYRYTDWRDDEYSWAQLLWSSAQGDWPEFRQNVLTQLPPYVAAHIEMVLGGLG
jgi:hypothetical protein